MLIWITHVAKPRGWSSARSCCNLITWLGTFCLTVFVLAEVPVVTDSVGLTPDIPTAAIQAPWLPSPGLVPLSLVTPVQLSLPMLTVHGWNTHKGLGHPLLTPPCHPSVVCGLMVPGDQGEQRDQQSCSIIKGHTLISPETNKTCSRRAASAFLLLQRCHGVLAARTRQTGCYTKDFRFMKMSFPRAGDALASFH